MRTSSPNFMDIREYLDEIPVINSHEHNTGMPGPIQDVLSFMLGPNSYVRHDLQSASFGEKEMWNAENWDPSIIISTSFDERYAIFERRYQKARHTAYCRSMLKGLEACWGVKELNRRSLMELQERMQSRSPSFHEEQMKRHNIKAQISDIAFSRFRNILQGEDTSYSKYCRFAFPLPEFHWLKQRSHIQLAEGSWAPGKIKTLDDYVESFTLLLRQALDFGIVCLKDQSAYWRPLNYQNPTRSEAEAIFNRIACHEDDSVSSVEARVLDDWLFQYFVRLAKQLHIPVQLHTGHLAGNSGDVRQANAAHLIPLLELHEDVKFDLFHANWPFAGEILFICKNFPNAYLNFCWAHVIDPLYCVELMKRAVMTVPHTKIIAYGGDTSDIEFSIGHLIMVKDIVAAALSDLIDMGWINREEAQRIALDWFFNNPNEIYGLMLEA